MPKKKRQEGKRFYGRVEAFEVFAVFILKNKIIPEFQFFLLHVVEVGFKHTPHGAV